MLIRARGVPKTQNADEVSKAEDPDSRHEERNRRKPVALDVLPLLLRECEPENKFHNEDDPDRCPQGFQNRIEATRQFEDQQCQPYEAENNHRRLEPQSDTAQ